MSRTTTSITTDTTPSLARHATLPRRAALSRRAALLSLAALPLAACAGSDDGAAGADDASDGTGGSAGDSPAAADGSAGAAADGITVTDPWVKAAEDGMTSAFGLVTNGTDQDLTLVAVSTDASGIVELHETADDGSGGMSMAEKEGGFPIPAGGELTLEPGGDHIMLMDLATPLLPGDQVELILEFDDGTEHPVTATVKDYAGANEEYAPDHDHDHDHDHGDGSEHDHDDSGEHNHGNDDHDGSSHGDHDGRGDGEHEEAHS